MKKIFISGATGEVGKSLCNQLSNCGYELMTSGLSPVTGWNHPFHAFDISDLEVFSESLKGISVLVHLAGQRGPGSGFEELVGPNIRGAYHAFEAALRSGVQRVVFASSVNVSNGLIQEAPISNDRACPSSIYGASKAFGEAMARYYSEVHGLSCICLRMEWTLPISEAKKTIERSSYGPFRCPEGIFMCSVFRSACPIGYRGS